MKPWQTNPVCIAGMLLILFTMPSKLAEQLALLIAGVSAVWVYRDAKQLGIQKYRKTWLSPSTTPLGAASIVLILWIVAFPMYISYFPAQKSELHFFDRAKQHPRVGAGLSASAD